MTEIEQAMAQAVAYARLAYARDGQEFCGKVDCYGCMAAVTVELAYAKKTVLLGR